MVGAFNNEDFELVVKRGLLLMKLSFIASLPGTNSKFRSGRTHISIPYWWLCQAAL